MIYLDYNASAPLRPVAREAIGEALSFIGNPSSPHKAGRQLRALIEHARTEILEQSGGKRLVFTSGGTEANAFLISNFTGIPLIISTIEHASILAPAEKAEKVPVTSAGVVNLEALETLLSSLETPGLLSLMLINNETGVIQPVQEAARLAHARGWKVHTDATQAPGHVPFSCEDLGVDFMTLSAHKCGGPIGIGALVMRETSHLTPLLQGAGQEYGMRSGTLPLPLILGFAAALKETCTENLSHLSLFQQQIETSLPEAQIYGKEGPRSPHVVCLGMPGVSADVQVMSFDLKGIAVGAGAACSSGAMKSSHVLTAMGVPPQDANCAIRMSMGWQTLESEVEAFIQAWKALCTTQSLKEAV